MMANLGVIPKGWLSFFGLKEQGANPRQFADALQASVMMNGFYQSDGQIALPFIFAALAAGNYLSAGPIVPPGKSWALSMAALHTPTTAASYVELTMAVAPTEFMGSVAANLALPIALKGQSSPSGALAAGWASSYFVNYANPLWLGPGSQIAPMITIVGAAVDVRGFLLYREVSI